MSVILTAGKKALLSKPKSANKKKKKRAAPSIPADPPVSTNMTTVWHFALYGVECTVMFNKQDSTVWCNGEDLETVDGFSETGMNGSVIDFYITLDDNSAHRGRITQQSKTSHELIVDGCSIRERTHSNQYIESIPMHGQAPVGGGQTYQEEQSAYAGYNGAGGYDGGYEDQAGYSNQTGYSDPTAMGYNQSYNTGEAGFNGGGYSTMDNGAYGGYNGLPSAAVYEPPPQYDDVVREKKSQ